MYNVDYKSNKLKGLNISELEQLFKYLDKHGQIKRLIISYEE